MVCELKWLISGFNIMFQSCFNLYNVQVVHCIWWLSLILVVKRPQDTSQDLELLFDMAMINYQPLRALHNSWMADVTDIDFVMIYNDLQWFM